MTEDSPKSTEGEAPAKRPRSRRSRRGGRGRGRKPSSAQPSAAEPQDVGEAGEPSIPDEIVETGSEPSGEEMPLSDSPIEEARREAAEAEMAPELHEHYEERAPVERRDFRPASPPAIADAIADVTRIIDSLRQVLDQLEEVLETLELAEVQKNADEREIQSLRNALRQLDRRGPESQREPSEPRGPQPYPREPRRHRRRR